MAIGCGPFVGWGQLAVINWKVTDRRLEVTATDWPGFSRAGLTFSFGFGIDLKF